jgi:hypothetical protein
MHDPVYSCAVLLVIDLRVPPGLALVVRHVSIPRRRSRELGAAVGAARFLCCSGLLSLMAQEVAKSRKLTPVAAVFPALWLRSAVDHPNVVSRFRRPYLRAHLLSPVHVWLI